LVEIIESGADEGGLTSSTAPQAFDKQAIPNLGILLFPIWEFNAIVKI
jgi:hypothetical protein